jgi:hypothetical protein
MEQNRFKLEQDAIVTKGDSRDQIESDIIHQVRNEIQQTILLHVPDSWSDDRCDAVEESALDHTRHVLAALSNSEVQSAGALQIHIAQAIAETKSIIRTGGV